MCREPSRDRGRRVVQRRVVDVEPGPEPLEHLRRGRARGSRGSLCRFDASDERGDDEGCDERARAHACGSVRRACDGTLSRPTGSVGAAGDARSGGGRAIRVFPDARSAAA